VSDARPPDSAPPPDDAPPPDSAPRPDRPLLRSGVISEALTDPQQRQKLRLPVDPNDAGPMVVELNLLHEEGLDGAEERFKELYIAEVGAWEPDPPEPVAGTYYRCDLSMTAVRQLVRRDQRSAVSRRAIYRIWPDFPVKPLLDRSVTTVKADAARRAYEASGHEITWGVIDSGIDEAHPHFAANETLQGDVKRLHKDFTGGDEPLRDGFGHGTHVAGIIAGGLGAKQRLKVRAGRRVLDEVDETERIESREIPDLTRLAGVAPHAKLVSLKVLDDNGESRSTNVLAALQYVREKVNGHGKLLRIHGVNLSLGYEFDAHWFACGQSPICVEVDRLVQSGVVVVVAAGNTGYGQLMAREGVTSTGMSLTINDPGNADEAITVGATHRDSPHTFGVSYFSSKGPTGDGRLKPDLVAPGERITSCAAGRRRDEIASLLEGLDPDEVAAYIEDSGTSMAAPHVSGAVAAFLSVRREFIGRPSVVKRLFCDNATSLGRERYFEGHGMVDLMRVIQAV